MTNILAYVSGLLLLALLGCIVGIRHIGNERDALALQLSTITHERDVLLLNNRAITDAKASVDATVDDLVQRLNTEVGKRSAIEAQAHAATQRASAATIRANTAQRKLSEERANAYQSDANAAKWRDSPVPDAVANSLLSQWDQTRATLSGDNSPQADRCAPPRVCGTAVGTADRAGTAGYDWQHTRPARTLTNGQAVEALSVALQHVAIMGGNIREIGKLQGEGIK